MHNDGDPVGDGSSYPEGARGQAQARDTPMMLATSTVAFSRVESNRIESNKSNRIESNGIVPRTEWEALQRNATRTQGILGNDTLF